MTARRASAVRLLLVVLVLACLVLAYVAGALLSPRTVDRVEIVPASGPAIPAVTTTPYCGGWEIQPPPQPLYVGATVDA
ncbi:MULTISPECIES: hypothetical protein [unclassified Leucobacter]|uniref:hypothetical protein n=1 Tax=unclassified Leucobacter TaxID=2621730 RepID=UPI0006220BF0|nr:hypothetical protein [Leucobacter sp. Ag1]KKI16388.1 hypothetical protein XM48_16480 [Leucobacter sp. Ag1]